MDHRTISFVKSGVRIVGYGTLTVSLSLGVAVLILSEILGIIEEWEA